MALIDVLSWALILIGVFFAVVGGVGMLRFPDFYTRTHALGVTDTLGAVPILLGLMLQSGPTLVAVKLFLILLFFLFTSPISGYSLAHAARADGLEPLLHKEDPPSKS